MTICVDEGASIRDIALRLQVSPAAVKSRLHRGREKVRVRL